MIDGIWIRKLMLKETLIVPFLSRYFVQLSQVVARKDISGWEIHLALRFVRDNEHCIFRTHWLNSICITLRHCLNFSIFFHVSIYKYYPYNTMASFDSTSAEFDWICFGMTWLNKVKVRESILAFKTMQRTTWNSWISYVFHDQISFFFFLCKLTLFSNESAHYVLWVDSGWAWPRPWTYLGLFSKLVPMNQIDILQQQPMP